MTSEGQHAGQQPAEATSGGPAELARGRQPKANPSDEPNGRDGFPPDSDGQGRPSTPPSAASYPVSYAPPPQSTPNGGSPFVVPTVFGQPAERQPSDALPSRVPPLPGYGAPATPPSTGSARVPRPEDSGGLPQRSSSLPQRGSAGPFNATAAPPGDNGSQHGPPPSAWAPPPAPGARSSGEDNPFARSAEPDHPYRGAAPEPHPYRGAGDLDGDPAGGVPGDYAGFAPGSPTRVRPGLDPADSPDPGALPDRPRSPFDRTGLADHSGSALGRAGSAPDRPSFDQPDFDQPSLHQPRPDQPSFGQPSFDQPSLGQPSFDQPSLGQPSLGQPSLGQPSLGQPSLGQPNFDQAGSDRPGSSFDRPGSAPERGLPESAPELGSGRRLPERGSGSDQPDGDQSGGGRTPGVSAFGAQRVRVPGATLTGLPDAPPLPRAPMPSEGGGFPVRSGPNGLDAADGESPQRQSPYGLPARFDAPGESSPGSAQSASPALPGRPTSPGQDGSSPFGRPGGPRSGGGSGFAQRVPGASFASGGAPVAAEVRGGPVPQPRDSAERSAPVETANEGVAPADRSAPAVGSARPVAASASVPVASRVAPPADPAELPPPAPAPQPRVYGRAAPAQESDSRDAHPDSPPRELPPAAEPARPGWATPPGADQADGRKLGEAPARPQASGPRPWDAPGPPSAAQPGTAQPWEAQSSPAQPWEAQSSPAQPWEAKSGGATGRDSQPWEPPSSAGPVRETKPWEAPSERSADAAPGSPGAPYQSHSSDDRRGPGGLGPEVAQAPAPTPQSPPGRASGRATASARVAPPPGNPPFASGSPAPDAVGGPPFSEPTADVAGRGRANVPASPSGPSGRATPPPESYSENTTDISGRGQGSDGLYVPAPALPSMHARPLLENGFPPVAQPGETAATDRGGRPRLGGVFPGPASRATVTPPPDPDSTTSWPRSDSGAAAAPGEPEQGRFDQFKPEAEAAASAKAAESPHVRMVPVLLSVIIGATLLVGLAVGIPWLISGGNDTGFSVSTGDCVKKSGDEAVKAGCGDPGSFEVVSIVTAKEQCADPGQPYVLNPTSDGKTQVLCLKPRG